MTTRRSYLQSEAEYRARVRAASPTLAIFAQEADEQIERDRQLEAACERLYGKTPNPASRHEVYAAEQSLGSRQVLKGRGED